MKRLWIAMGLLLLLSSVNAQEIKFSSFEESVPLRDRAERILAEAFKRMGMSLKMQRVPGPRSVYEANLGLVDGELYRKEGIESMYPNLVRVPVSIVEAEFMVFTKTKSFPVEGWQSLKPYTVGYLRGVKQVEKNLVPGTYAEAVPTLEVLFRKLDAGRTDVAVEVRSSGLSTIKKFNFQDIHMLEPSISKIELFPYLHVKNQHLVKPLTAILQQMEKEGAFQKIQQQVDLEWRHK